MSSVLNGGVKGIVGHATAITVSKTALSAHEKILEPILSTLKVNLEKEYVDVCNLNFFFLASKFWTSSSASFSLVVRSERMKSVFRFNVWILT